MNPLAKYLPTTESQAYPSFDTYACTNYALCNLFETYINRMIGEKTISLDNAKWLSDNRYLDKNGSLNFSDQFNVILSGTEWGKGNSFEKVSESAMRDGLVPDSLFTDIPISKETYYDRTLINQKMINMGQEFLRRFKIEVINKYADISVLKTDLLWITISVCPGYGVDPIIPVCVYQPSHAVLGYDIEGDIVSFMDTYPEYLKKIRSVNVYAKWQLKINQIIKNKMILTVQQGDLYITDIANKFAWSIPDEKALEGVKKHFALIGNPLGEPVYQDLTEFYVVHGGDIKSIKEFFNI